jgi:hypothetical protein
MRDILSFQTNVGDRIEPKMHAVCARFKPDRIAENFGAGRLR